VAELLDSHAEGFADGGTGHVYTFGGTETPAGGPNANEWDLLFINSNTVVSTPSGFDSLTSAVASQGVYWFGRKAAGGEGGTVTITTTGNHNTQVSWERWGGLDEFVTGAVTQANNSNGTALPDASTGTLPQSGLVMIVGAALHNFDGALATSPVWSDGFTGDQTGTQGSAGTSSAVVGFTGYKANVGTASEPADVVTWTNNARNRYATWVTFSQAAGGTDLTAADSTHGHTAESPALTQAHMLASADAGHGHTAEQPALTQDHQVGAADASHGHTADQPALSQVHAIAVDDASHTHTAAQPTLTQLHVLAAGDAIHGHTAESALLTQAHTLNAADALHAHTADQVSLSGTADLSANDAAHGHTADQAALVQAHALVVLDALHAHLAEIATVTQQHQLVAADARHTLTSDTAVASPPVVPGILHAGSIRPKLTAGKFP
jgi:hypothetical protein